MKKEIADILYNSGLRTREEKIETINEDDEIVARQLEAEARLLDAFSKTVNAIKSLKYIVSGNMGVPWGNDDMDSMKDAIRAKKTSIMLRMKLKKIAYDKLEVLKSMIDDIFGPSEKEKEAAEENDGTDEY